MDSAFLWGSVWTVESSHKRMVLGKREAAVFSLPVKSGSKAVSGGYRHVPGHGLCQKELEAEAGPYLFLLKPRPASVCVFGIFHIALTAKRRDVC